MKCITITIVIFSFFWSPPNDGDMCTASASNCSVSCSATAPSGGSVDCYESADFVECTSYDDEGRQTNRIAKECSSSGSGSGNPGGSGQPDLNCQIYWWTCSQAV